MTKLQIYAFGIISGMMLLHPVKWAIDLAHLAGIHYTI
jgi:hypothetical protein